MRQRLFALRLCVRIVCWLPAALPKFSWLGGQKTTLLVPKDWTPERTLHSKAPTASVYPQTGAVLFGRATLKFFWPPLKPKTTLLIFLSPPKGGVRVPDGPGPETGTGRVRCRS